MLINDVCAMSFLYCVSVHVYFLYTLLTLILNCVLLLLLLLSYIPHNGLKSVAYAMLSLEPYPILSYLPLGITSLVSSQIICWLVTCSSFMFF